MQKRDKFHEGEAKLSTKYEFQTVIHVLREKKL